MSRKQHDNCPILLKRKVNILSCLHAGKFIVVKHPQPVFCSGFLYFNKTPAESNNRIYQRSRRAELTSSVELSIDIYIYFPKNTFVNLV